MPAVTIVTAAPATTTPVMTVLVEGEAAVSMITAPPVVETTAGAWTVAEQERPGRKTITQANAPGLRTLRFDHVIAAVNPYQSVESLIAPLRTAAEKGKRVQFFNAGTWASGNWWLIRSVDIVETEKASNNTTSRATISWDCIEASAASKVELTKGKLKLEPIPGKGARPPQADDFPTPSEPIDVPDTSTTPAGNTTDPKKPYMPY